MSYGLSGGGARNVQPRLSAPPASVHVTRVAPGAPAARAGMLPVPAARLWGSIPVESVEGHEPEPFYDVRPASGLGFWIPSPDVLARQASGLRVNSPRLETSTSSSVPTSGTQPGTMTPSPIPRLSSMFGDWGPWLPAILAGGVLFVLLVRR